MFMFCFFQQSKRGNKQETPLDAPPTESESHLAINPVAERDDEVNPTTPAPPPPPQSAGLLESSTRDLAPTDSTNSRLRSTDPTTNPDQQAQQQQQQNRVQFTPANNYYKNVSDNKDVAKLVSLLVTCINATKKVIKMKRKKILLNHSKYLGYYSSIRYFYTI